MKIHKGTRELGLVVRRNEQTILVVLHDFHHAAYLRGYEHQKRQEATVMEKKEIRILEKLGFTNPYLS